MAWPRRQALIREKLYTHFIDSAVVTVGSTSIALVAGSLVAYGIARHRLGGTPFRFFLLAMRTLPAIAIVIPIYTMFRELRLLDTYWALILVYPVYMTPLVAWIMVGFFREVPREMEEAALIDGCSQWGLFWRVGAGRRPRPGGRGDPQLHRRLERVPVLDPHQPRHPDHSGRPPASPPTRASCGARWPQWASPPRSRSSSSPSSSRNAGRGLTLGAV